MLKFAHFARFPPFPTKVVQNNLEGLILAILHCFPIFNYNTHGFFQNGDYVADSSAISPTAFLLDQSNIGQLWMLGNVSPRSGQSQVKVRSSSGQGARMDGSDLTMIQMDLIQMDDYPADSYAISPTAFL